jgi:hypothetical protein
VDIPLSIIQGKWILCQSSSLIGYRMKIFGFARVEPTDNRSASCWKDLALAISSRLLEGPKQHWGYTMDPVVAWVPKRASGGCPAHSSQYATLHLDASVFFALPEFPMILTCIIQISDGETSNQYHYVL